MKHATAAWTAPPSSKLVVCFSALSFPVSQFNRAMPIFPGSACRRLLPFQEPCRRSLIPFVRKSLRHPFHRIWPPGPRCRGREYQSIYFVSLPQALLCFRDEVLSAPGVDGTGVQLSSRKGQTSSWRQRRCRAWPGTRQGATVSCKIISGDMGMRDALHLRVRGAPWLSCRAPTPHVPPRPALCRRWKDVRKNSLAQPPGRAAPCCCRLRMQEMRPA